MKKMPVITAVVLGLTMLLLAPLEVNAGGRGGGFGGGMRFGGGVRFGGHGFGLGRNFLPNPTGVRFGVRRNFLPNPTGVGFGFGEHFRSFRDQNNFGSWWPWDGYGYGAPYTDDDYSTAYQTPQTVVIPEPPQVKCQHSEQKVTVPSANGGTTEVTILRC